MAKIYKIEGYIIAPNEDNDEAFKELQFQLESAAKQFSYPSWWPYLRIQQADIENFTDDHPLNFDDVSLGALEKYFIPEFFTKKLNMNTEEQT